MTRRRRVYHCRGRLARRTGSLVLAGLLLFTATASAQIVNTLEDFDPNARGAGGSAGVEFDAEGGNTDVVEVQTDMNLRYLTARHTLRAMFGYDLERADGEDQSEDTFAHLRHNRRLVERLHSLLFVQWQRNPFQRLERRILLGAGARFDAIVRESGHLSIGAAHMAEFEKIDEGDDPTAQRLSAFVNAAWTADSGVVFAAYAFLQPRWADFGDLRAIASGGMQAPIAGGLALAVETTVTYDAEPPGDVETTDWELSAGLRYAF